MSSPAFAIVVVQDSVIRQISGGSPQLLQRCPLELIGAPVSRLIPTWVDLQSVDERAPSQVASRRLVHAEVSLGTFELLAVSCVPVATGATVLVLEPPRPGDLAPPAVGSRALREASTPDQLLAHAADIVVVIDDAGRISYISRTVGGLHRDQVVGVPWQVFVPAARHEEIAQALAETRATGQHRDVDVPSTLPRGSRYAVRLSPVVLEGAAVGIVAVCREVTTLRRAEEQVAADQQLATLGLIAGSLGHDINNPLVALLGSLEMLLDDALERGFDPDSVGLLVDAKHAATQISHKLDELRVFARADRQPEAAVDVVEVVSSTLSVVSNEVRHRARLVTSLGAAPDVIAKADQLGQVFFNLVLFAAWTLPEGQRSTHDLHVSTGTDDGRVLVCIRACGGGMTAAAADELFSMPRSTSMRGAASGLQLAMCQRIITTLNGELQVNTAPGAGVEIRVLLPPAPQIEEPVTQQRPTLGDGYVGGTVLVIDDDPGVLRTLTRLLSPKHRVLTLSSGVDLVDLLTREHDLDLVLCDMMMPERSGADVFRDIERIDPALARRVVFITGGTFSEVGQAFLAGVDNPVIAKPFDTKALRHYVEQQIRARLGAKG